MQKLVTLLLLGLISLLFARVQFVVMVKDVSDVPKLLSFAISNEIVFEPTLPPSKTPRERTEVIDRLERYYSSYVEKEDENIQKDLLSQDWVEAAWYAPEHELPFEKTFFEKQPLQTPNFQDRQGYLNAAPLGVNMFEMFNRTGGRGEDVQVVDVEGGWDFDHEDLKQGRLIHGSQAPQTAWTDHGSAVLGEIAGIYNGFGVTGIASQSKVYGASIYNDRGQQTSVATTFIKACEFLRKGDLMLIELHRGGPRGSFIAMNWWPDNHDALKFCTGKGVIVLGAAGNGNQNLDHPDYNRPQPGFPPSWKNPFNRTLSDDKIILCGAGAPSTGGHGPDRSRLGFSNYGNTVDTQGWGREVVTLGYGDLQRAPPGRTRLYTKQFSGTSSASPIVVGVVASVHGYAKKRGVHLGPLEWRKLLRQTGSPQTDAPGRPKTERIGNRPDTVELRKLIDTKVTSK